METRARLKQQLRSALDEAHRSDVPAPILDELVRVLGAIDIVAEDASTLAAARSALEAWRRWTQAEKRKRRR